MNKIKEGIGQWARLNLLLLACMVFVRLFFYFMVHTRLDVAASEFGGIMKGFVFDGLLLSRIMAWLAVPFLAFHWFFPKTTTRVYMGLIFVYVVVAALLNEYFCNLTMPLDHVVLVYSPEEVKGTASSSANLPAVTYLWFLATVGVSVLLALLWRKVRTGWWFSLGLLVLAVALACLVRYKDVIREERYYDSHDAFCLAVNQPSYSYIKITDYLRESKLSFDAEDPKASAMVLEAAQRYQALRPEFEFISQEYPFMRKANDPDVLGGFLDKTSDSLPPNFVFIIVEGLGQNLSNLNEPMLSFTPFIDQMKREGLFWRNGISSAERTFGVLPSVFASAPYGKYGFCVSNQPMPDHHSMLRDLKDNGYEISYYYGGVHSFDRYDLFLKSNNVDFIYVPDMRNIDSATYKILNEAHRWGLDDGETFQYAMNRKREQPSPRLNVDIYMTLTTHEPFLCKDVETYEKKVDAILAQHPETTEREVAAVQKNKNIYACYLYMDDCVRQLVDFYKTLPDYQNTVFVLTGDHRMGFLDFGGPLNKYNVPVVIFSPLVKQPRAMEAVVSHLDVTPTLNAYLHENYDYKIDSVCHWLGTSFDTVREFRNTRKQAFMLNNRDVLTYINGHYVVSNNRLFTIERNLLSRLIDDPAVMDQLKQELRDFNVVGQYAVQNGKLNLSMSPMEELRNELCDFEGRYSDIYKNCVIEQDDGHVALMDSTKRYAPLFDKMLFNEDYDYVFVNLSFDLQSLDTERKLPVIAVELGDYYISLKLVADDESSLNTGKMEHYHYKLPIPVPGSSRGKTLKMYLFNAGNTRMIYDNIKVNVTARK